MKALLVVSLLLVVGCSALVAARVGRHSPKERTLTIRVTSANPNKEALFDASYLFRSGDSQLQHVEQVTPFEVSAKSDFVTGIFRQKSDGGMLVVQLTSSVDGETEKLGNEGRGDIVVLGTTSSGDFPYSVQALTVK